MSPKSTFTLSNNREMPVLGLGTYKISDRDRAFEAFLYAIEIGYRHFDTAALYGNEEILGEAIRKSGVPRRDFFVTTKLWNDDQGYEKTQYAFERSNELLGLGYIDLYLIHWPVPKYRLDSWKALEVIYSEGLAKAIGVSNYMQQHLNELLEHCQIKPMVNQLELHPWNYLSRKAVVDLCTKENILITAYCPLTRGVKLAEPKLADLSKKYDKTPAQMLLRWGLQHGISEIPKSGNPYRIDANRKVFDFQIDASDMASMDSWDENLCVSWNPEKAL